VTDPPEAPVLPDYLSEPCAVTAIDLDQPLRALDLGRAPSGRPYGWLRALVRLHGDLLATIELPAVDGRVEVPELGDRIWQVACDRLRRHVRTHGCVAVEGLTRQALDAGFAAPSCGSRGDASDRPFVSVIVPTAGRAERLADCIASIVDLEYPDFELVVVDNAPADASTREVVAQWSEAPRPVRYVAEPVPGSSRARNRGIASTTAEILAFTDDDILVDRDWLERIVAPFVADRRVGVVTGLVMAAQLDTLEERQFEHFTGFGRGLDVLTFDTDQYRPASQPLFPYWGAAFGASNNVAFRRSVLERIGGFDEVLGVGGPARASADIDSFTHALVAGARLVYEPRAVCWHYHRSDADSLRRQVFNYAVGTTAVLGKWSLRDPRLLWRLARTAGSALLPSRVRQDSPTSTREAERFRQLLRMSRDQGMLARQLAGFALGPALYARGALRLRRGRSEISAGRGKAGQVTTHPAVLLIMVTDGAQNGGTSVVEMLDSLAGQVDELDVILVVRGDIAPPSNGAPRVHTVRTPLATSLSRARNLALRYAHENGLLRTDQIVGFPDDDCLYPVGLLRSVADLMRETGADVVCGAFAPSPDTIDPARFPPHRCKLTPRLVPALPASATIFSTGAVLEAVGYFDERFGLGARFGGGEDQDYVMRAVRAGFGAVYDPDAVFVCHPYKAHRRGEYYAASMALLAKHARHVPRLWLSLGYRFVFGAGRVLSGKMKFRYYVRGIAAAIATLSTGNRDGGRS
jgi:O-antigen biosynthesis protein